MRIAVLFLFATATLAGDLDELREGVGSVGTVGVPGPLCVFGPDAFVSGAFGSPPRAATFDGPRRAAFERPSARENESVAGGEDHGSLRDARVAKNAARLAARRATPREGPRACAV